LRPLKVSRCRKRDPGVITPVNAKEGIPQLEGIKECTDPLEKCHRRVFSSIDRLAKRVVGLGKCGCRILARDADGREPEGCGIV
jgi:hypothetical protein